MTMCSRSTWTWTLVCSALLVNACSLLADETRPLLVPQPKHIEWSSDTPLILNDNDVAIVAGLRADGPEQYAAEMLQQHVAKRFQQQWPILTEASDLSKHSTLILLGRRSTNDRLNKACKTYNVALSDSDPGHDGYVIEMRRDNRQSIVLIGGSNARGVIYGQDTLFQMLVTQDNTLTLAHASVRDYPSVPWRGRPQTHFMNYLRVGELDCYAESRINFIDLRSGTYAFEAGAKLDKANLGTVINEAHRRGMIVYGTVNCGIAKDEYPAAMRTYEEFIDLGADGLWISFDDKGPGEEPETIVADVIALGRKHKIIGKQIAVCPPKGSYQDIITDFNKRIIGIPGADSALWFWTRWPAKRYLDEARSIGLKSKPAWWHNWPRLYTPHSYIEPPSMAVGWHAVYYETIADGDQYIDAVMPWGGNAWGAYYIVPVIGWWGWTPGQHDWKATRHRMYDIVFGSKQVPAAMAFDDTLVKVKTLMRYSQKGDRWQPYCPVRLARLADRGKVSGLLDDMKTSLETLTVRSASDTMLDAGTLHRSYLDPMKAELSMFDTAIRMPYPEYWWEPEQRKILAAIYDGDLKRADQLIDATRNRILEDISRIANAPVKLRQVDGYVSWWKERANLDAHGWQASIEKRREEFKKRVAEYAYFVADPQKSLAPLKNPPLDWGSGRWQASNQVLTTVLPTDREFAWGNWIGGIYREGDLEAAVFTARRKNQSFPGEYSELELQLPLSKCRRDRLSLLLFVNHAHKDAIGGQVTTARWAGYRFLELLNDGQILWETDLGRSRPDGEWFMIDLPVIPDNIETLNLQMRVIDRKLLTVNHTVVFVGPIRLIERQE